MRWAVVTGAGSGIGAVIARHAAKAGYRVALWDIEEGAAAEVAVDIGEAAVARRVDVTSEDSVAAGFAALSEAPALLAGAAEDGDDQVGGVGKAARVRGGHARILAGPVRRGGTAPSAAPGRR